jgi:hypothetical protein
MTEEWRPIKDYEGFYEVSNLGRVRSVDRIVKSSKSRTGLKKHNGKILRPGTMNGYRMIILSKFGKTNSALVHRLVAHAFVRNTSNFIEVNHLNGIKEDNRAENLEWTNRRENASHSKLKGGSSKYVGVSWKSSTNIWLANIKIKGRSIHLGYFNDELDARDAYLAALEEYNLVNKYAEVI